MHRRRLLIAALPFVGGCLGSGTPTPSPTPPEYVSRFETALVIDDIDPLELSVEAGVVTLVYAVSAPRASRIRETVRDVATAYAQTIGRGWSVVRLRATIVSNGDPAVRYRIETEWAEAFNAGGTGAEYGEKIEGTVERTTETPTPTGTSGARSLEETVGGS